MISYDTGIQSRAPVTPAMQQQALAGLASQGVMQYPGSAADVYRARALASGIEYERAATDANNEHLANSQKAQQTAALAGLQQMAQAQQNENDLKARQQSARMNYMQGGLNGLLSGVF